MGNSNNNPHPNCYLNAFSQVDVSASGGKCVGGLLLNQNSLVGVNNKLPLQKISYSPGTLESGKVVDRWMVPDDGYSKQRNL